MKFSKSLILKTVQELHLSWGFLYINTFQREKFEPSAAQENIALPSTHNNLKPEI